MTVHTEPRTDHRATPRPPADDAAMGALFAMTDTVTPFAVRAAATLRLADHLDDGPIPLEDLAELSGVDPELLLRLLRHLVTVGVFAEPRSRAFAQTAVSALLHSQHPAGRRAWLDLDGPTGRSEMAFARLLDSIRTGSPGYRLVFGQGYWEDLNATPALRESFDRLMAMQLRGVAEQVVEACDWQGVRHVVDVGGGNGTQLAAVLHACPSVRGTLVEEPGAVETAAAGLVDAGLGDRSTVVAGSFFEELPAGADTYLLCLVLHNWDDRMAGRILGRCRDALAPDGRVIVVENAPQPEMPSFATAMDLRMLVTLGGRERDESELQKLAAGAGLAPARVTQAGTRLVMELVAD